MNYYVLLFCVFSLSSLSYGMEKSKEECKKQMTDRVVSFPKSLFPQNVSQRNYTAFMQYIKKWNVAISLIEPTLNAFVKSPYAPSSFPVIGNSTHKVLIPEMLFYRFSGYGHLFYEDNLPNTCYADSDWFPSYEKEVLGKMKNEKIEEDGGFSDNLPFFKENFLEIMKEKARECILNIIPAISLNKENSSAFRTTIIDSHFFSINDKKELFASFVINCNCYQVHGGCIMQYCLGHESRCRNSNCEGCGIHFWTAQSEQQLKHWGFLIRIRSAILQVPLSGDHNNFSFLIDNELHGPKCRAREWVEANIGSKEIEVGVMEHLHNKMDDSLLPFLLHVASRKPVAEAISYFLKNKQATAMKKNLQNVHMYTTTLEEFFRGYMGCNQGYPIMYDITFSFVPDSFCLLISYDQYNPLVYFGRSSVCGFCKEKSILAKPILESSNGKIITKLNYRDYDNIQMILDGKRKMLEGDTNLGCERCRENIPLVIEQGISLLQGILTVVNSGDATQYNSCDALLPLFFKK